jgi:hypothetical protein
MADQDNSDRPFQVGYRKPPKHTQFRKGTSGNPKGRGKGVRNFATEIEEDLNSSVPVTENGKHKRYTKRKAIAKRLVAKAATGDPKAITLLLNETRQRESAPGVGPGSEVLCRPEDQLVMASIVKRIRETDIPPEIPSQPERDDISAGKLTPETGGAP